MAGSGTECIHRWPEESREAAARDRQVRRTGRGHRYRAHLAPPRSLETSRRLEDLTEWLRGFCAASMTSKAPGFAGGSAKPAISVGRSSDGSAPRGPDQELSARQAATMLSKCRRMRAASAARPVKISKARTA